MNKLQEIQAKFEQKPEPPSSIPPEFKSEFEISYLLRVIEELRKIVGDNAVNEIAERV